MRWGEDKTRALKYVQEILGNLRYLRDIHTNIAEKDISPLRHSYNDACDRLDILESRLIETLKDK